VTARGAGRNGPLPPLVLLAVALGMGGLLPQGGRSQELGPTHEVPPPARFGLRVGWGNFFGGIGAMAEVPLSDARVRPYASLGYRGGLRSDGHKGLSGAAGVQFFKDPTDGSAFWGISVMEIAPAQRWFGGEVDTTPEGLPRRSWGPAIHGGWRSGNRSGWTIRVESGAAVGLPDGFFAMVTGIGVGYSWP
jgi:hypothetical protein